MRLGGSSRNGSSSAFAAGIGAGAGALRGGGSALVGSHLQSGAAVGNHTDDTHLSAYEVDEGYVDEEPAQPLDDERGYGPTWNWDGLNNQKGDSDSDNVAFDADDAGNRMLEDFDDEPSWQETTSTPLTVDMETVVPVPADDDDLAEIHVDNHGKQD